MKQLLFYLIVLLFLATKLNILKLYPSSLLSNFCFREIRSKKEKNADSKKKKTNRKHI